MVEPYAYGAIMINSEKNHVVLKRRMEAVVMDFGENLQQLRKEKGWSQENLADLLEVSRQAISKWESDAAYPETEKLVALSGLFDVSIDDLIKGAGTKESVECPTVAKKRSALLFRYRRMRTALAAALYTVSPFWFYVFGESPGGSGRGTFFMFLSIAAATGLLLYNHSVRLKEK